jgi:hypothetical protein
VLAKLMDLYAAPDSPHPVPGGGGVVLQVFLLPAPSLGGSASTSSPSGVAPSAALQNQPKTGPQLAVVNLAGSFATNHPSGIATETLTLLSICGTVHANLPRVTQVRFLVDGKERETLAGHADLTRAYLVGDEAPNAGAHL